jgi:hypothetical protein
MGGPIYPITSQPPQDMNNQNSQKSLVEVKDELHIVLDKLGVLIQRMVDECDAKGGCCK